MVCNRSFARRWHSSTFGVGCPSLVSRQTCGQSVQGMIWLCLISWLHTLHIFRQVAELLRHFHAYVPSADQLSLQVTSKVVAQRPLTMLIPTLPLLLYASLGLFWMWSTIYLYTSCEASAVFCLAYTFEFGCTAALPPHAEGLNQP